MANNAVRFVAVLFAALALVPTLAHLMELPHKIGLDAQAYLTVQQIYRGWSLLGIVVAVALLSSLALAIMVRARRREFIPALVGFLCIAATQGVFWSFTFPVNQATVNWTFLPANWMALRAQWEYSHALSAVFNLAALVALICCVLARRDSAFPLR